MDRPAFRVFPVPAPAALPLSFPHSCSIATDGSWTRGGGA